MNKAIIMGNLGTDPELRYTQSGTAVCNLSVATNERWTNKEGEPQERTEWHKVTVWGRQAENCEKYLSKGRKVLVEGRIETQEYEKDGQKRYSTQIVANNVQFLGGGGGSGNASPPQRAANAEQDFDQAFNDDDIPF